MVIHVCDFYVFVLFHLSLVGDPKSVGVYLLILRFSRKWLANLPNEYFGVFKHI